MPAPTLDEIRSRARVLAAQHGDDLDQLRGKRIRVLRAVVYEGDAEAVFDQLARSLPIGTRDMRVVGEGGPCPRSMLITVVQEAAVVLVSAGDLAGRGDQLRAWQHAVGQLPAEISVVRFDGNSVLGCPEIALQVGETLCYALAVAERGTGDVQYMVRSEPELDDIYVSVTAADPRGIIGGMVDEIGRATLALAAR